MKIHQTFLLSIGFLVASALSAQTTTLLNDSFASAPSSPVSIATSGSSSAMGQNLSAAQAAALTIPTTGPTAQWFPNGTTATSGAEVYTNATSPSTTGSLVLPALTSQSVTAYFLPFTSGYQVLTVGDALTLTFNFTLSNTSPPNNATAIRFGLFNSGSTTSVSNQSTKSTGNTGTAAPSVASLYSGYYCGVDPAQSGAPSPVVTLYSRAVGVNTNFIGSTSGFTNLGTSSATASFTNNGTDVYQAVLTVFYQSVSSMTVIANIYDTNISTTTPMANYTLSEPASLIVSSFDGFSIGNTFATTSSPITLTNATVTYIPQAALPIFTPGAGTYTSAQSVAISSIFTGLSFAYTTDGSTPTESSGTVTNGTLYTAPIAVGTNTTLKAISFTTGTGGGDSAVASAAYVINLNGVSAPAFSPAAGNFTSAQSVSITSATSGASIRFTIDGSTPTETVGTLYSGPVSISATTTLKAIAFKSGSTDSAVTSGTYTITAPAPTPAPTPPVNPADLPHVGNGGGAFDDWFLALLALAGLLRWRQSRR